MSKQNTHHLDQELKRLRAQNLILPRHPGRARDAIREMYGMASSGSLRDDLGRTSSVGSDSQNESTLASIRENSRLARAMRTSRTNKTSFNKTGGMGDVYAAIPRFYDPMEFWDLSGLPWNMADEGHRHKLHKWMRLFYMTHYLVPILVDIFTRFPLSGMYLDSKDKQLTSFYEDIFLDQLNYPDFLVSLGREYWMIGEAFPLASFNEHLGTWEREELINPEDVIIENYPLLGSKQMKIVPPDYLKRIARTKQPAEEYKMLVRDYADLIPFLERAEAFPVSDVLMKQIAFRANPWDDHGTPILLRGLRTLIHEEKLLASQDAIAERLYSPLILAKLGATDLGDGQGPWIPGPSELEQFRDDLDVALSSDFRVLVHHFGLEVENVFGREQMPDLWNDFDRIERRLMQVFGINPSLLGGGVNSQPYASSALQAEFMNQMLRTYQDYLKAHYRERAMVVAEAHEHYDYEKKGQTRIPIYEEVVVPDPEAKEGFRIEKRQKLLIPDMEMAVLDMRDEATERQFLQTLRSMGVPIADDKLMVGIPFEFKDSLDQMQEEMIAKTVAQQEAKMETYKILTKKGLPVPPDLMAEIAAMQGVPEEGGQGGAAGPGMAPGGGPIMMPSPPGGMGGGEGGLGPGGMGGTPPGGGAPPASPINPEGGPVPEVSNERRPGLVYNRQGSKKSDSTDLQNEGKSAIKTRQAAKNPRSIKLIQESDEKRNP
jgi:hypothetical protein